MAINLASKYSDQIAEVFTRASFIKGKTAETYDLTGVKTLKVYTPITVEEVDYDRDGGLKRYGDVTEMQDVVQELTMTQDKAFTLTIDKGNNLDQNLVEIRCREPRPGLCHRAAIAPAFCRGESPEAEAAG